MEENKENPDAVQHAEQKKEEHKIERHKLPGKSLKETIFHIYDKKYKLLLIIPFVMLVLALAQTVRISLATSEKFSVVSSIGVFSTFKSRKP